MSNESSLEELIERLEANLSEDERRWVLAGALRCLEQDGLERLLRLLEPETGMTLRQVLEAPDHRAGETKEASKPVPLLPSAAKILEQWEKAWRDWQVIVDESMSEDGAYVYQEHHWEEPWLDADSISADLDTVAERIRPLIPQVIEHELEPGLSFADALSEAKDDIGSGLPEWITGWDEEGGFGHATTSCLLDWEWLEERHLSGGEEPASAFAIIDEVRRLEEEEHVRLNGEAIKEFVFGLEIEAQREILTGIQQHASEPRWEKAVEKTYFRSHWFEINKELLRRLDPSKHLELCKSGIDKDWHLALPVLRDLLEREAFREADDLASTAQEGLLKVRSYKRQDDQGDQDERLLVERLPGYFPRDESITELLSLWAEAARGRGHDERAAELGLERAMVESWDDWDLVLKELGEVSQAGFHELSDRLYRRWRIHVSKRGLFAKELEPSWVGMLLDAARRGEAGRESFFRELRQWLETISSSQQTMSRAQEQLQTLTDDLDTGEVKRLSPTLHEQVYQDNPHVEKLKSSRVAWLRRLGAEELIPELVQCWRRGIGYLMPDPRSSHKSRYYEHARWLRIAYELDRDTYHQVVARWKVEHKRRRNLWKAIKEQGLPGAV